MLFSSYELRGSCVLNLTLDRLNYVLTAAALNQTCFSHVNEMVSLISSRNVDTGGLHHTCVRLEGADTQTSYMYIFCWLLYVTKVSFKDSKKTPTVTALSKIDLKKNNRRLLRRA